MTISKRSQLLFVSILHACATRMVWALEKRVKFSRKHPQGFRKLLESHREVDRKSRRLQGLICQDYPSDWVEQRLAADMSRLRGAADIESFNASI